MRTSVEKRRKNLIHSRHTHHWWQRRYVISVLIVITVSSFALLFLAYANWQQVADAKARQTAQANSFADLDSRIKKTLVDRAERARRAEETARENAASAMAAQQTAASTNPTGTVGSVACTVTQPDSLAVVVNKKHCFQPIDWAPSDLTSVNGYLLRASAASAMSTMMNAAALVGAPFDMSSAYRSYANQVATYNNWVAVNGSQAAADTVSARPGYSEHQTGLAADLKVGGCALECFGSTSQYQWLKQHAADYGFIERYPSGLTSITGYSSESWHWRYVGTNIAQDMKAKNIQTLEQYFGISGGDYN